MKINLVNIPFTYSWIVRRSLSGCKTILDLGCSDGDLMKLVNHDRAFSVTGIDLYGPDLTLAKKTGVYKKLIKVDIRKIKIQKKSFDAVLSSQVIEHLPKSDGLKILKLSEAIATKKVVYATPVGFLEYNPIQGDNGNNIYQKHLSGWEVSDFTERGYKVFGQGMRLMYMEGGLARLLPSILRPIIYVFSFLFSPIVYLFPKQLGYLQIAVKKV